MKKSIFLFLFCTSMLVADVYNEENSYEIGNGIQVASLPLYIGGYFSADYKNTEEESRYRIDDIAFLAYGDYSKFSYLAELEFKDFYTYTAVEDAKNYTEKNTKLHLERLYVDYTFNENYMLRAGKYNAPIGYWNLLPINVLRETTSNPKSTEIIFPKFTTGLDGTYTSYGSSDIQVDMMLQHNTDLDASYNNYQMDEHYGLGVNYSLDALSLKLNVGLFDSLLPENQRLQLYYALASLKYETENYQIMSELGMQHSKDEVTTNYAGYLQGVYHFNLKHAGILRVESYDDKVNNSRDDIAIFAYTYRPMYPIAFKGEYQLHTLEHENQFLVSFSVLF